MRFLIVIIVTFSLYSLTTVDCPADYGGVSVLDGSESWSLFSIADSLPPPDDVTKVLQSGRYPYYHHINLLQYHGYHGTSTSSSTNTTFTLQVWNEYNFWDKISILQKPNSTLANQRAQSG